MAGPTSASNLSLSSAMGIAPSSNPDLGDENEENHLLGTYRTPVRCFSRSNVSGITNDSGLPEEQRGEQLSVGVSCSSMHHRDTPPETQKWFGVMCCCIWELSSVGSQESDIQSYIIMTSNEHLGQQ